MLYVYFHKYYLPYSHYLLFPSTTYIYTRISSYIVIYHRHRLQCSYFPAISPLCLFGIVPHFHLYPIQLFQPLTTLRTPSHPLEVVGLQAALANSQP